MRIWIPAILVCFGFFVGCESGGGEAVPPSQEMLDSLPEAVPGAKEPEMGGPPATVESGDPPPRNR